MKQRKGTLVTAWGSQEATSKEALETAWPTAASPRGHRLRDEKGMGVKVTPGDQGHIGLKVTLRGRGHTGGLGSHEGRQA